MYRIMLLMSGLLFSATLQAQWIIEDKEMEVRTITGEFNKIMVEGNLTVYLVQSEENQLAVSGSSVQSLKSILTESKDGVLKISGGLSLSKSKVYIAFKDVSKLDFNGNITVVLTTNWLAENVEIKMNGVVGFKGKVQMLNLKMDVDGVSKATLDGDVKNLTLKCNGTGKFVGPDLMVDTATIDINGVSKVEISAIKKLYGEVSGISEMIYHNKPEVINVKVDELSKLKRAN